MVDRWRIVCRWIGEWMVGRWMMGEWEDDWWMEDGRMTGR